MTSEDSSKTNRPPNSQDSPGSTNDSTLSHKKDKAESAEDMESAKTHLLADADILRPPITSKEGELQLQTGAVIKKRFLLVEEVGFGGMGVVYTARDLRKEEVGDKDSIIAIKLLSDNVKSIPETVRMLQQESKKSQTLAHPNIVTVYDFDRDGDTVYMTMEFLTGKSLKQLMRDQQIPRNDLKAILPIITGIVNGLQYAHEHGIVHSDLKPANIYITEKNVTKLLDFGIARAVLDSEAGNLEARGKHEPTLGSDDNTNTLVALTPSYASLEMFNAEPPDPRDDVYALACITYQLLTGKPPFKSAKLAWEKQLEPQRIAGLTDREWHALQHGLSLKREDRTESAQAFLQELLPKRREPWKYAAATLAVIAIVLALFYGFKPPEIVAPSLFENPPPEASLSSADQQKIDDMLEIAEVHLLVGRLISPPGSNALDEFNNVLKLHPFNRRAIKGLKQLLDQLALQANAAIQDGDRKSALQLIDTGLSIHNAHQGLLQLKQKVTE